MVESLSHKQVVAGSSPAWTAKGEMNLIAECNLCGFDVEIDPSDDPPYGNAHEKCRKILMANGDYKLYFSLIWKNAERICPELCNYMRELNLPDHIMKEIEK